MFYLASFGVRSVFSTALAKIVCSNQFLDFKVHRFLSAFLESCVYKFPGTAALLRKNLSLVCEVHGTGSFKEIQKFYLRHLVASKQDILLSQVWILISVM